jgi:hypothetical protein
MNEVDKAQASNHAREWADKAVRECFRHDDRESMEAHAHWAREFRRQFDAFTKPAPGSIVRSHPKERFDAFPG